MWTLFLRHTHNAVLFGACMGKITDRYRDGFNENSNNNKTATIAPETDKRFYVLSAAN